MNRFLKPPDRVLNSFSNTEKLMYDYLIANIATIPTSNISNLSQEMYTTPASFFNLLKKMGYSGFKEFKYEAQTYLKELERITPQNDSNQTEFAKIIEADAIIKTCRSQEYEQIKQICIGINESSRVLVIANEITRYVAQDFTYRLQLCDVDIIACFDQKQYKVLLAKQTYDYVIVFSKFGNTEKIINAVETSEQKIDLLITTNQNSYLKAYSTTVLCGASPAEDNLKEDLGDISSRICLFILADMIINTYIYTYIHGNTRGEHEKI